MADNVDDILAEHAPGEDVDSILAEHAPEPPKPEPPQWTPGETFAMHAANLFGAGPAFGAAVNVLKEKFGPASLSNPSMHGASYDEWRAKLLEAQKQSEEQHPHAALAGKVGAMVPELVIGGGVGRALGAAAPAVTEGIEALSAAPKAVATGVAGGAGFGAAQGAGTAASEGKSIAAGAAKGAATGAVVGGVAGPVVGAVSKALASVLPRAAGKRLAIALGDVETIGKQLDDHYATLNKAAGGGFNPQDLLTPLENKLKTLGMGREEERRAYEAAIDDVKGYIRRSAEPHEVHVIDGEAIVQPNVIPFEQLRALTTRWQGRAAQSEAGDYGSKAKGQVGATLKDALDKIIYRYARGNNQAVAAADQIKLLNSKISSSLRVRDAIEKFAEHKMAAGAAAGLAAASHGNLVHGAEAMAGAMAIPTALRMAIEKTPAAAGGLLDKVQQAALAGNPMAQKMVARASAAAAVQEAQRRAQPVVPQVQQIQRAVAQ